MSNPFDYQHSNHQGDFILFPDNLNESTQYNEPSTGYHDIENPATASAAFMENIAGSNGSQPIQSSGLPEYVQEAQDHSTLLSTVGMEPLHSGEEVFQGTNQSQWEREQLDQYIDPMLNYPHSFMNEHTLDQAQDMEQNVAQGNTNFPHEARGAVDQNQYSQRLQQQVPQPNLPHTLHQNAYFSAPTSVGQGPERAHALLQPAHIMSIFRTPIGPQSTHLMSTNWWPPSGKRGIPVDVSGEIPYDFIYHFVVKLREAMKDISQIWDKAEHFEVSTRFCPANMPMPDGRLYAEAGAWIQNPDDIETVCYLVVNTCLSLHSHGAKDPSIPGRYPLVDDDNANYTFAERLWLLEKLFRHYKVYAGAMMRHIEMEGSLIWAGKLLWDQTDFQRRWGEMEAGERESLMREWESLTQSWEALSLQNVDPRLKGVEGADSPLNLG
ncbi:hypothetical protein P280DRAFT_535058 [Massarina eburnea CBS 473.64]|uniref:Uncharacterized protein n=1 Tax=Massarina eburnea CBS 473.64 TaxID=1395130 RepID=A0A6A6SBE4_9PLEO|nr:hypothetical protein P280DRAFT_535058 [Massarina eburnea CBS 473.64]